MVVSETNKNIKENYCYYYPKNSKEENFLTKVSIPTHNL